MNENEKPVIIIRVLTDKELQDMIEAVQDKLSIFDKKD